MNTMDATVALNVPKSELHLHLDGSLDEVFIAKRALDRGVTLPVASEKLRQYLHNMKSKRVDSGTSVLPSANWSIFDFCNQFLQTEDELREATFSLCRALISENVVVAEIRFCPELHVLEGMTVNDAVSAVVSGFQLSQRKLNIRGGIIVCALRSYSVDHSIEMAELAAAWLGNGVVGFDIAGDEGAFPLHIHSDSVKEAVRRHVPTTLHAGEWPVDTVKNIELAVELGASRIGHGITLCQEPELMARVAAQGIAVECCLTSNVGWKVASYAVHPIRKMFDAGVQVCINSDNLLLSGSHDRQATPTGELNRLVNDAGFSWKQARQVLFNGVSNSFDTGLDSDWFSNYERGLDQALETTQSVE